MPGLYHESDNSSNLLPPTTRTLKYDGWIQGYVKHPGEPQLHNRKTGCYIIGASVKFVQVVVAGMS